MSLQQPLEAPEWSLSTIWQRDGSGPVIKLVKEDDFLYILTADQIDILDASTGDLVKTIPPQASPWSDLVARNGILIVKDDDGALSHASSNGDTLAELPLASGRAAEQLLLNGESLYISHREGTLSAYDLTNKRILWEKTLPSKVLSLSGEDSLYVGTEAGQLFALDPLSGEARWTLKLSGPMASRPTPFGRWLFLGDDGNFFYTVHREKGKIRWRLRTGGDVRFQPLVHQGVVYVAAYDNRLYALRIRNGNRAWERILSNRPTLDGLIVGDLFLLATFPSRHIELFRLKDGSQAGVYELENQSDYVTASPVQKEDQIYIGTYEGSVLCLELQQTSG